MRVGRGFKNGSTKVTLGWLHFHIQETGKRERKVLKHEKKIFHLCIAKTLTREEILSPL